MGINDKDYANALEHQRLHERALMKLELQKQKEEAQMAISTSTSLGGLLGGFGQQQAVQPGAYQNVAVQNPYSQQQLAASNTGITLNTSVTNATWSTQGIKTLNEQDLKHDAMLAPLSSLVDLWMARWQGEWVSETEFQEDDFWRLALIRLVGANKLEKHHLASSYYAVYRIIE